MCILGDLQHQPRGCPGLCANLKKSHNQCNRNACENVFQSKASESNQTTDIIFDL